MAVDGAKITHDFEPAVITPMRGRLRSFQKPLRSFYGYLIGQTARTFKTLGRGSASSFRGVVWPWFAPIRSGGEMYPPWGEPPRIKGRLRASGQRVTPQSQVLSDTGVLRAAALAQFQVSADRLTANTNKIYANKQNAMRPFAFMTEQDLRYLESQITGHVTG